MSDEVKVEKTVAEKIWDEIKDKDMALFALDAQTVSSFCKEVKIEPSKCYVIPKVSAVLPALEETLGKKFACEMVDKYIVISRVVKLA
jgi:hypothetical protein